MPWIPHLNGSGPTTGRHLLYIFRFRNVALSRRTQFNRHRASEAVQPSIPACIPHRRTFQNQDWGRTMKKQFQIVIAAAMVAQPAMAAASECPSNFQLVGPYWVITPVGIATPLIMPGLSSDQNLMTIVLNVLTIKGADGITGCAGSVVERKGLVGATLDNPPPPQPPCSSTGSAGGNIFNDQISASVTNTFIGRVPLSLQTTSGNQLASYDYRIIVSKARISSVCYSPVGANGSSELWDGRG